MNDFYDVANFIMGLFEQMWAMLYEGSWLGLAILGFVVVRLIFFVFRTVTTGALSDGDE